MANKTRSQKAAKSPRLYEFLVSGLEICHSELPTLRQCLRYGLLICERSLKVVESRDMCRTILSEVKTIWNAANPEIYLVSDKYALDMLVNEWKITKDSSKEKVKSASYIQSFKERLDKLFDLAKCKCKIYGCAEQSCEGCEYQAHVICKCPRNEKIPLMELKECYADCLYRQT